MIDNWAVAKASQRIRRLVMGGLYDERTEFDLCLTGVPVTQIAHFVLYSSQDSGGCQKIRLDINRRTRVERSCI